MYIKDTFQLLFKPVLSLFGDTKGGISTLMAAGILVMVGLGGIATDTARAYLVKSRLSTALDAAGLAGGWSFFLDTRDADVDMFFNTNYPTNFLGSSLTGPSLTVDEETETLSLEATATVPTLFMTIFGIHEIEVHSFVEVTREMQALDVVLAMDMSGSMGSGLGSGTRMSAARQAASDLIDILYGDNSEKDLLNVGLVPWNSKVNITLDGTTFDSDLTTQVDIAAFTNPVTTLTQDSIFTINNSPVPLLWAPPSNWEGCVHSRYIDDDDEDTNGDTTEQTIDSVWVEWPAWEHVGPGSEPASSNGSDITIIQSASTANQSDSLTAEWSQTPKATNILVAAATRASGSQFDTPAGWTLLADVTADDGTIDRYISVFAKVATASEVDVTFDATVSAHQGLTIFEVANIDWTDLVDDIRVSDHSEFQRNYVSLNSADLNNTGNLLIAVAGLADDDFSGFSWSNSFTALDDVQQSGDGGEDLTHAVAVRKVSNTSSYSTTLSTTGGANDETWGLIIALEDRNVCSATVSGSECTPCLSHGVTPLTNVKATIQSAVDALLNPTGTTNITEGLGWAWRVLTPAAPFTEAVADPDYNRQQAIVLLTDGENFGGNGDGYKTVFGNGTSAGADGMDDRLQALANNVKGSGVVLYVIQFANNGTALQTLLQNVASGPNSPYYHYAPDAASLQDVFREVANHLSQLRLSK